MIYQRLSTNAPAAEKLLSFHLYGHPALFAQPSIFETFPPPDTWRAVIAQPKHSVQTFLFHKVEKIG